VREQLEKIKTAGYEKVSIRGEGDVADICRLSCLEQGVAITNDEQAPVLEITGLKVILHIEENHE
jgi:hypothetical protein